MFRLIGLGEQAGSGIPQIYQNWSSQHWRKPSLIEKESPSEQTLLELRMLSLVPNDVIDALRTSIGDEFDQLCEEERLILVTAFIENTINHARIMEIVDVHPHDLTKYFARLTELGFLQQDGVGRGTIYFLPLAAIIDEAEEIFGFSRRSSGGLEESSGGLDESSGGSAEEEESKRLSEIAEPVRSKKKTPKSLVEEVILELCEGRYLSLQELELLLDRSGEFLRKDYLQPLIRSKRLQLRFPTKPNHPQQAYTTVEGGAEE